MTARAACGSEEKGLKKSGKKGEGNSPKRGAFVLYCWYMALPPDLSLTDSFKSDHRKAFYERHKGIALMMILIVFLFPLIGVFAKGLAGAALGMVSSVLAYYLAPYALLKLGGWFVDSKW